MTNTTIETGPGAAGPLLADLHLPEGQGNAKGPWPLVVGAHGGGWSHGARQMLNPWGAWFAARGIAFATVDYRRVSGPDTFPGNAADVATSLRYFAEHGADHGIDPARIVMLGVSAGAHLGALALMSPEFDTPKLRGFIGVYGVYDLMGHWQADVWRNAAPGTDKTHAMLNATPFDDPDLYHRASPLHQIRYETAMPALVIWGESDREVLPEVNSVPFARALTQARADVTTVPVQGAGHRWFSQESPDEAGTFSAQVAPEVLRFVKRQTGR